MPAIACSSSPSAICVVDSASVRFYSGATLAPIGSVFPSPALLGPSNDYACAWDARSGYFILANAIPGCGLSVAAVGLTRLGGVGMLDFRSRGTFFAEPSIGGDDRELAVAVSIEYGSNVQLSSFWDRRGDPFQSRLGRPSSYRHDRWRTANTMSPIGETYHVTAGFNDRFKRTNMRVRGAKALGIFPFTAERWTPCGYHPPAQVAAARNGNTLVVARPVAVGAQVCTINVGPPFPSGGIPPSTDTGIVLPGVVSVAVAQSATLTGLLARRASDSKLFEGATIVADFPTPHTAVCALPDGSFAVATPDGVTRH